MTHQITLRGGITPIPLEDPLTPIPASRILMVQTLNGVPTIWVEELLTPTSPPRQLVQAFRDGQEVPVRYTHVGSLVVEKAYWGARTQEAVHFYTRPSE